MYTNEDLILLLGLYIINYPVLASWRCTLGKPIGLVFDDYIQANAFIEQLAPNPEVIDLSMTSGELEKAVRDANLNGIFFYYSPATGGYVSKKLCNAMDLLFSIARSGKYGGKPACVATFLIFENFIPEELKDSVFEVHVGEALTTGKTDVLSLVPDSSELSVIKEVIRMHALKNREQLKAAVAFTYPKLKAQGNLKLYERLLKAADMTMKNAADYRDADDISDLVISELLEYYVMRSPKTHLLPQIGDSETVDFANDFFSNGDSMFISERLFKEIVGNLLKVVKYDVIKFRLVYAGILLGSQGKYTQKMYCKINGRLESPRMMRFNLRLMPELRSYLNE